MAAILTKKKMIQCFYLTVVVLLFIAALYNFTSQLPTFSAENTENFTDELELILKNRYSSQALRTDRSPLVKVSKNYWLSNIQYNQITELLIDVGDIFNLKEGKYLSLAIIGTISIDRKKCDGSKHEVPKNRMILKEMINQNPGISLRELQRKTGLAMGVIQYHLQNLENEDVITMKNGRCKHFFDIYSKFSQEEKIWLSVNQNPKICEILEFLKRNNGKCYQRDIVHRTGNSRALISYYIKILEMKGIIETNNNQLSINEKYLTLNVK